jgi:hypothetical protein
MLDVEMSDYVTTAGFLDFEKIYKEVNIYGAVITNRNLGKTYGSTLFSVVDNGLTNFFRDKKISEMEDLENLPRSNALDWMFMLLRRTQTQVTAHKELHKKVDVNEKIFDFLPKEAKEKYASEWYFDGSPKELVSVYIILKNLEDDKIAKFFHVGYMAAISSYKKLRGPGIPQVKLIIVEEFQEDKYWNYLPDEPEKLQDIWESILRDRPPDDCKVILLGNANTLLNPYFAYYNYTEFNNIKTSKRNGTFIVYHLPDKPKKSQLYLDLVEGTSYGDYAYNNKFKDYDEFNLMPLKYAAEPRKIRYNIFFGKEKFGVWRSGDRKTIISRFYDEDKRTFVDRAPLGKEVNDREIYVALSHMLREKQMYFDTADIRLIAERYLTKYLYTTNASQWKYK